MNNLKKPIKPWAIYDRFTCALVAGDFHSADEASCEARLMNSQLPQGEAYRYIHDLQ